MSPLNAAVTAVTANDLQTARRQASTSSSTVSSNSSSSSSDSSQQGGGGGGGELVAQCCGNVDDDDEEETNENDSMSGSTSSSSSSVTEPEAPAFQYTTMKAGSASSNTVVPAPFEDGGDGGTRRTISDSSSTMDIYTAVVDPSSSTLNNYNQDCITNKASPPPPYSLQAKLRSKLHHRAKEALQLQEAFQASLATTPSLSSSSRQLQQQQQPQQQLLLISGASGCGKTRLATDTLAPLVGAGYFITGKFDNLWRPYSAFVMALNELCRKAWERGPEEVRYIRQAIDAALGNEKEVLTSMIPALGRILGDRSEDDDDVPSSLEENGSDTNHKVKSSSAVAAAATTTASSVGKPLEQASIRFNYALRISLRCICSQERPLVLFLDDLQHADGCSLDILYSLATDPETNGLILVTACDDSVQSNSYFASKLRDMEDKQTTTITNIALENLDKPQVHSLLSETMEPSMDEKAMTALSQMIFEETRGNILHITELLNWLEESEALVVSSAGTWTFHPEKCKGVPACSHDLLMDRMMKLPQHVQDVLRVASCLGSTIDEDLIGFVLDFDACEILRDLYNRGLLSLDESRSVYIFEHDEAMNAADALITEEERERLHLEIGRRIWRKLSLSALEKHLFLVIAQFHVGKKLISRQQEQVAVATLCLHAGKKAARASAFFSAAKYFELGVFLMENDAARWRHQYDLMLALHNAAGEMHMCKGNVERMETLLEGVFVNARMNKDKLQAYTTRIYSLSYAEKQGEAVDLGVKVLKELGETFPNRLCNAHMVSEFHSVRKLLLKGKTDEQLLRLPRMTDETKMQCLQILNVMLLPTMLERPRFTPFVLLKTMKITLQHGLSVLASTAFATYGMLCLAAISDTNEANRFARLALILLDRFKSIEYLPRVYAAVYGIIYPCTRPTEEALQPLLKAHFVALETGDVEFASLCSSLYSINAMETCTPLQEIDRKWQEFKDVMVSNRQTTYLLMSSPHVQVVHHLMGTTDDPLDPKGNIIHFDEFHDEVLEKANVSSLLALRFSRMKLCYFFKDYEGALKYHLSIGELWMIAPTCERASGFFFYGLIHLALAHSGKNVRKKVREALKVLKMLQEWARQCPENLLSRAFLIEAEVASVQKKRALAYEKYICAISLATTNDLPQDAALACERLADHLERLGNKKGACRFLEKACNFYTQWGAFGKVRQIRLYMQSKGLSA